MNYEFYDDMNALHGYMTMNNKNDLDLFNPYEGFLAGNAFKDQYVPYKNYKIARVNINSEKEEMLFNIGEYSFMMHDMNLYLDTHPKDQEAVSIFNEYRNKTDELVMKYERKYGPLMVSSSDDNTSFNWINGWPWVN